MKNTFWFRHFLLCDELAKKLCSARGWTVENFAECILEENKGRYANSQMTNYFWVADKFFCDLHASDEGEILNNVNLDEIAKLSGEELRKYYEEYCYDSIKWNLTNE